MKLKHIITGLVLLLNFAAQAEEAPVLIKKASTEVVENSSEHNRMGKKWTAQWQLFGAGANGTSQSALIGGYYLDRNSLVQLEAGGGGMTSSGIFMNSRFELSGTSYGIHYKRFLANSFYFKTGVDYRSVSYSYNYSYTNALEAFEGNSFALSLVIGNQWQWDNFTLGCDWIGFSAPFASETTSVTYAGNDSFYRDEIERAKQDYLKNGFAQGLRFYIGYAF